MAFQKTVLEAGSGIYRPNKLAKVVVDVTGKWYTSDGDDVVFDQRENVAMDLGVHYLEFNTFFFVACVFFFFLSDQADSELGRAIEEMVYTMKQGERSRFLLTRSGYCLLSHSHLIQRDQLPPMGAEVSFTIHLRQVQQGKDVWELMDQERLEMAKAHKERGSALFKTGHVRSAAMCYSKSVQSLAPVDPDIPLEVEILEEHEREILSLRTVCLMNLAACQLKLEQYSNVVRNCSRVLELEPGSTKSWYRRAKALLAMRDFEAARADLLKARELDPGNQAVSELLKAVETQELAQRAKYRDALKAMFN